MADKDPCRYLGDDWFCAHPLMLHYNAKDGCGDVCAECEGCPCHEPQASVVKESLTAQPDPTPDTCRWTQDEFKNWFSGCSGVMPTVTPWDGKAIHGMFCPECGKRITTQVHDKP